MEIQGDLGERLERIEIKLAYMEDFLSRLQDEFLVRLRDFDRIRAEQETIKERIRQISRDSGEIPHRKPPHY
jgi:SlyX protein